MASASASLLSTIMRFVGDALLDEITKPGFANLDEASHALGAVVDHTVAQSKSIHRQCLRVPA
jgi:hypothetical protein